MSTPQASPADAGPFDRGDGRVDALRSIEQMRRQSKALHDFVVQLAGIPGRERDANNVSREAAILDAEIALMLQSPRAEPGLSDREGSKP